MQIGSNCFNCEECLTHYTGGCIAGHGDDHFTQVTKKNILEYISRIKTIDPYHRDLIEAKYPGIFEEATSKEVIDNMDEGINKLLKNYNKHTSVTGKGLEAPYRNPRAPLRGQSMITKIIEEVATLSEEDLKVLKDMINNESSKFAVDSQK